MGKATAIHSTSGARVVQLRDDERLQARHNSERHEAQHRAAQTDERQEGRGRHVDGYA